MKKLYFIKQLDIFDIYFSLLVLKVTQLARNGLKGIHFDYFIDQLTD